MCITLIIGMCHDLREVTLVMTSTWHSEKGRNSCFWHNPNTASGTEPACYLMEAGRELHLRRCNYSEIASYRNYLKT